MRWTMDFSERRSKEVINFFWRTVYTKLDGRSNASDNY